MLDLLLGMRAMEGVNCGRGDLFNRVVGVLRKQCQRPDLSLEEAADQFQGEFRSRGRPVGRRLIGTTLLLKGLEFDHGIVLDARSLAAKDLYVALTRGSRSISIITTSETLTPAN
jgi:DNA helicase-2/ATP-dependent DNA helicase PcrA